ncbi:uncharacterized protein N7484_003983 [Penicillium longicatenatum]|uniref:uncharacterized protein n=1 Tax=Penicillium longicatenatum TaxID=1561947 RepID=UPI00254769F0|nr:uncharacterized protein N7484_003983 [Penicillium longicatenatum]KAJ5650260.1 hypothetical protein N7484_003983 [Penicillium longicatenatum]
MLDSERRFRSHSQRPVQASGDQTGSSLFGRTKFRVGYPTNLLISSGPDKDEDETVCIGRFEQWAYEALQLPEKDTLWHTQMAIVYTQQKCTKDAIERSKLALNMDPNI